MWLVGWLVGWGAVKAPITGATAGVDSKQV